MPPIDNSSRDNRESTKRLAALVARLSPDDMQRSLGGNWSVGFALAHLAFWDARQVAALNRFAQGEEFPTEDLATNAALEGMASAFDPATVGPAAVSAARQLDQIVESLNAEQIQALQDDGKTYAIDRAPHREEHIRQIEDALG